jgi:hypothetical protein
VGWFDDQAVPGYNDWISRERNLGGNIAQPPAGMDPTAAPAMPPAAQVPSAQMQMGNNGYPLAAVAGQGLMAPFATGMQTPDWQTFSQNPAYQFRMDQGRQAIERGAAAKGTLLTGGTLKDLTAFGQGLASQEYNSEWDRARNMWLDSAGLFNQNQQNQFNRLSSMAGLGQQSAGQTGAFGSSYANNAGDLITGAGNANAAGQIGAGNAWNSAISDISQNAMLAALMRRK